MYAGAGVKPRDAPCVGERFVQVLRVHEVEAAELFLGFGERAIHQRRLAIAKAEGEQGRTQVQSPGQRRGANWACWKALAPPQRMGQPRAA